jgi:ParB family chromosome partitioning protein
MERLADGLGQSAQSSSRFHSPDQSHAASHGAEAARRKAPAIGRTRFDDAAIIDVGRIVADPDQPRDEFNPVELRMLGDSIKERGQLQPIRVRWREDLDRYMIIVGERRWRAAVLVGLPSLLCIVGTKAATPEEILEDQLIENCLRIDLSPRAEAAAIKRLMDAQGLTVREVAAKLRMSLGSISDACQLLDLPEAILARVDAGTISRDAAVELTKVGDPAEQAELAAAIEQGKLGRDALRARTRKATRPGGRAWSYVFEGEVKVVVSPMFPEVSDETIHAAIKAAAGQFAKDRRQRRAG